MLTTFVSVFVVDVSAFEELLTPLVYNMFENHVAKTNGFKTFTKFNVAKTNGFSNIIFGNVNSHILLQLCFEAVVKPMASATLFLEIL